MQLLTKIKNLGRFSGQQERIKGNCMIKLKLSALRQKDPAAMGSAQSEDFIWKRTHLWYRNTKFLRQNSVLEIIN